MKLFIDIGNTRIKWALLNKSDLEQFGHSTYSLITTELPQRWRELGKPESVFMASVASAEVEQEILAHVHQLWGIPVTVLETRKRCCGLVNGYRESQQLGIDRWAAMVGAYQMYKGPLCVVDCGSAVTIDVVTAEGHHLGGYIAPGLAMQQRLLRQGTAAVDFTELKIASEEWGLDTSSCLMRGSVEAIAGLIERSYQQLREQLGIEVNTVITGGDATGILPRLGIDALHEEHLVLQGMTYMVREQEG